MISRELLKKVLLEQRNKIKTEKKLVPRKQLEDIRNLFNTKQSIIITGIRRCGKSTLFLEIIKEFFNGNYYYIDFQDERLSKFEVEDFDMLYEVLIELFGENKTFFLDEIQNILNWEKWIRRMYDNDFKFFITGSNAKLLSKELATLLTGRHINISLYPFSFREYLMFKGYEFNDRDVYLTERRSTIIECFNEYLERGGFPEYLKDNRIEILQEYFNDIIYNDVGARYNFENVKELKELARYLITNSGCLTSYNKITNSTNIKSPTTVIKYFGGLENAYLIIQVPYFSYSLRKQTVNPFKVYTIDTGLRNAVAFKITKDKGKDYETLTAVQLARERKEFYYWKDSKQREVDFLVKEGNKVTQMIQVCYYLEEEKTKEREISGLITACKEFKLKEGVIITEDKEGEEEIESINIKYIPLWKWLLRQ